MVAAYGFQRLYKRDAIVFFPCQHFQHFVQLTVTYVAQHNEGKIFSPFHGECIYANAPQRYVIRTLPI